LEAQRLHGVALPEVAEVGSFEAAIGFGPLLGEEVRCDGVAERQVAAEGAWGDALLGDGVGLIEGEYLDDRASGAQRLLTLERLGAIEGLLRDGARLVTVGTRLGFEALKALFLVDALPPAERGRADGGARRIGNLVMTARDLLTQGLLAAGRIFAPDEGQDERVTKECDRGASVFGLGHINTSFKICTQYSRRRELA
jgi:hypothetical protein